MPVPFWNCGPIGVKKILTVLSGRLHLTAQHLPLEVQEPKRVPEGAGVRPVRIGFREGPLG
jgi:hypothetical protein